MRVLRRLIHIVCISFITFSMTISSAIAGGFSIREQSTSGQGSSFAGNAAGHDLSVIYWNPAGVNNAKAGLTTESHAAVILPNVNVDPDDNSPLGAFLSTGSNGISKDAFVPASYASWRISDEISIGYGINAPFGLGTEASNQAWAGQYSFREAELFTLNFNPVIGYKLSSMLSVGVGLQVMYSELELKQASGNPFAAPSGNDPTSEIKGDDWSFGFTLGAMLKPMEGTTIGVGYRSRMNNTLEGDLTIDNLGIRTPVKADFDLPEILTISLRQDVTSNLRVLGTFEWSNWSILKTVTVQNKATGGPLLAFVPGGGGATTPATFEANWDDGYFLSGGLEFDYSEQLTVRGGVGYEWSPVQEPSQRLIAIPDVDRLWLSVGATYNWSDKTSFDIAYTHIIGQDERLEYPSGAFNGSTEADVDIIGVSFKTKWGDNPLGVLSGLTN